jgi:hypothetical protein
MRRARQAPFGGLTRSWVCEVCLAGPDIAAISLSEHRVGGSHRYVLLWVAWRRLILLALPCLCGAQGLLTCCGCRDIAPPLPYTPAKVLHSCTYNQIVG